jgi:hypothetical protein
VANAIGQHHSLGFRLDVQLVSQDGPAGGVRMEDACTISQK